MAAVVVVGGVTNAVVSRHPDVTVCDRTAEVRDAIVEASGMTDCAHVARRHLQEITELDLSAESIAAVSLGDFGGLDALRSLDLSGNDLTALPAGVFDELYSLRTLRLHDNDIATLPVDVFDELFLLETLTLHGNDVTELPDGMFDDLSRFKGVHLQQNVSGLERLKGFLDEHSVESVDDFVASLTSLHKERFAFVNASGGLGAEFVSNYQPRVVSWGANAEFVFAWLTNPEASDTFKHSVEFLIPGETQWTAGVIDFSGDELEIRHPETCQSCHGAQNKPLFPADDWKGTEYPHGGSDFAYKTARMEELIASTSGRLAPLDLDPPEDSIGHHVRMLPPSPGSAPYIMPPEELSRVLAFRHAELLLARLHARDDYEKFAEDTVCSSDPQMAAQAPFYDSREHTLGVFANSAKIVGEPEGLHTNSVPQYDFRTGTLNGALAFLMLHELWEKNPEVRQVYRATSNEDTIDDYSFNVARWDVQPEYLLVYPPGEATAEDEMLQLYRVHFGDGNRASMAIIDAANPTHLQDSSFISDLTANQVNVMAPKVCSALRSAKKAPRNVKASVDDGEVTLTWEAPTDASSLSGYRIVRSTDPDAAGSQLADKGSAVVRHVDTTVQANTTYFYRVKALQGTSAEHGSLPAEIVVPASQAPPLTARAESVPVGHDGTSAFSFELHFSEAPAISYTTLRGSAFEVTGGTINRAGRRAPPSNLSWDITVTPTGDDDVVLVLATGRACTATGAVCTADGTALSESLTLTIPRATASNTALTARAEGVPDSHDGASAFTFQLHFSEAPAISYTTLRGSAFEVTGGTINRAGRRAPPSNLSWDITVTPTGEDDVVLVLATGRACTATGAVCTADGTALSESLTITIPGP